ncbi:hypothetical protein DFH08DRAFT_1079958 [Mycena albidolilacea]|uniref:Uncharacterized protein n=1 Tax=Mycena albidolilacea TaxID=1033008 RepID=A0AAD7ERW2_9AGAR|nr:hypothetical protein DFH08DRAFT_1079958 [Mycena albidolilacea]
MSILLSPVSSDDMVVLLPTDDPLHSDAVRAVSMLVITHLCNFITKPCILVTIRAHCLLATIFDHDFLWNDHDVKPKQNKPSNVSLDSLQLLSLRTSPEDLYYTLSSTVTVTVAQLFRCVQVCFFFQS